ncbi:MAG: protein lplB [Paenibacillaceae bacterium]|nr:protein lplB [Paenibacillaceae bacterium]
MQLQNTMRLKNGKMASEKRESIISHILNNKLLYLLILPGLIYLIIFNYIPMYGVIISFQDFDLIKGIWGSKWVGFQHFHTLFTSPEFLDVFINSVSISLLRIFWGFPAPIILALLLNEVTNMSFKRITQSVVYLPHFVSWVVISGIVFEFLSPSGGVINEVIKFFGGQSIAFLQEPRYFRSIIVISDIWKEIGWGSIIYLAAMVSVPSELYEAGIIDGASRIRRIWHITLPGISSTIIVILILRMGSILKNGFEQIFLLYNPMVYNVADVFETYTYRVGLISGKFALSSAVGLFQSIVGLVLIVFVNKLAKKYGDGGLW